MTTIERQSRRTRIGLGLAALAILFSMLAAGFSLIQRFDATTQARQNNRLVWHAVICEIERAVYRTPQMTPKKRALAIRFYNDLLVKDVSALPCSRAEILGPSKATTPRR